MTDKIAIKRAQKACFFAEHEQVRAVLLRKITHYFIYKRTNDAKCENTDAFCATAILLEVIQQ